MPNGLEDDQERTAAWLQWPAHVPPPATKSTNDDTPSLQQYNIICQTICLSLVTVLLILRIYTKGRVLKCLGWDDCKHSTASRTVIARRLILVTRYCRVRMGMSESNFGSGSLPDPGIDRSCCFWLRAVSTGSIWCWETPVAYQRARLYRVYQGLLNAFNRFDISNGIIVDQGR